MFENLSKREKILIIVAFIIAFSAIYYFYFYEPLKAEISTLKTEKDNKENRLITSISLANKLPKIKKEYKNLKIELENRGRYTNKDVIDLLVDFREIAKNNNLQLILFKPKENDKNISMTVKLKGGFKEATNLLDAFKDWNYWFEFKDVNISRSGDGVLLSITVLYHDRLVDQNLLNRGVEIGE